MTQKHMTTKTAGKKTVYIVMAGRTAIAVCRDLRDAEKVKDISAAMTYMPKSIRIIACPFWSEGVL